MIKEIDVHGLTTIQAKNTIMKALKEIDYSISILRIIHGYNNGNALKNMIRSQFKSHPKIERIELSMNQGITDFIIKRF
jgi:DNA-nicking Smr family endonuclease